MPKMKTHKGTAKRFRVSGSGKIRRRKAWANHLFKSKSVSRQLRLKGTEVVDPADVGRVRDLLGR